MIGDGMTDYEACPPGVRTCIHYCVSSLNIIIITGCIYWIWWKCCKRKG